MKSSDRLEQMFGTQEAFMHLLQEKRGFPQFPMDLTSKNAQKEIKKCSFDAMGELFEAVQHLKNSKDHRATDVPDLDRDAYVEELIDCLHYFIEIAILSGVTSEELFSAYIKKGETNVTRILEGY